MNSSEVHQDARDVAARSAAIPMSQERRIGNASLAFDRALDLLREAYRVEMDREGPWQDAIRAMQEHAREGLKASQAIVLEMMAARRGGAS